MMMQNLFVIIYKGICRLRLVIVFPIWQIVSKILFYVNGVQFTTIKSKGIPFIVVSFGGECIIGENFRINNTYRSNPIGRISRSSIFVGKNAYLSIGRDVGMSCTALNCKLEINIGNNVILGGGTCIYDSDFHSLNFRERAIGGASENIGKSPVIIHDNVFIGAHSTILKGVTIGMNSIVGACSVVTKDIPPNEIWAGNPAKFIRSITNESTDSNLV